MKYSKESIEPVVFCKIGRKGPLVEDFENFRVKVHTRKMGYLNLISLFWFYKYLKKENFNSICDFTGNFSGLYMLVAWLANVKIRIASYRQGSDHFNTNRLKRAYNEFVKMLALLFSSRVLFNSNAGKTFFIGNKSRFEYKSIVINNGIHIELDKLSTSKSEQKSILGIPDDSFVIGHTGRYNVAKNHPVIIDVFNKLSENNNKIYLVLAGDKTENIDQEFDLYDKSRVRLLGYRNDINSIIQGFDLFFFPSITEGQPNSLLEAMASNIPVVTSDILPILEVLPKSHWAKCKYNENNEFIRIIQEIISDNMLSNTLKHSEHVKLNFNAEVNFELFLKEIKGGVY